MMTITITIGDSFTPQDKAYSQQKLYPPFPKSHLKKINFILGFIQRIKAILVFLLKPTKTQTQTQNLVLQTTEIRIYVLLYHEI